MELKTFIENFAAQFDETDESVFGAETVFKELEEWSSLIALSVIAMIDEEYDVRIKGEDIRSAHTIQDLYNVVRTKLLQKSEMRKNMVMDLIYRGFIYAANYSESHYNPRRSQIKTELRYLFVTTPNR